MYANFTNNTIYESYDQECLQKLIPDENSLYNTKNEDLDFIPNHLKEEKNREICQYKAPPQGLYLVKVEY